MDKIRDKIGASGKPPRRSQVGLTLTEATKKRLERICEITGMNKCAVISMCINTYAFEKLNITDDVKN